ncbi:MAG TPA: hypothetical protein VHZ74_11325 [Bryobacteraceae bacterium]|nr:hypothetical protein [Bryobacteraceae bacterium]
MNARKRPVAIAGTLLLLAGCAGSLPRELRNQIASEKTGLQQTEQQLKNSQAALKEDLAHSPALFAGTPVLTQWPTRLQSAQSSLDRARNDLDQLDKLGRASNNPENIRRAKGLLGEERALRQSAVRESESVVSDATSWLDFERNVPHYVVSMQQTYDDIHHVDLTPVSQAVQKAGEDWPARKSALDGRFSALKQSSADADTQWSAIASARQDASAGNAKGAEVATLIEANDALVHDKDALTHGAEQLQSESRQLYDSWDKILADLEVAHRGGDTVYTEKLTTVRTHYTDVAAKKTETSTDTHWTDISAPAYHAVENDLGMTIAHKDAGLFDSEAQTQAQPPGFAYIASPEQGRNQYGYWDHSGGHSVWTWLPEYLIMRDLLWGHSYRPIYVNEYNGFQTARRAGRTYYGQETSAAPPKYGSHGTFTTQRYASSRYVQSGGYSGSAYSSNRSATAPRPAPSAGEPRFGSSPEERGAGKRFGGSSGGQKFGSGSSGQRFGSPRPSAPRMPGRRFGRR